MNVVDILSIDRTFIGVEGASKKRVLENTAGLIAQLCPEFEAGELFDNLIARERLGSTAIGRGIAIPHSRANHCQQPVGCLLKLAEAVDFDALDNEPVDLLFVLLVPQEATDDHLKLLSQIAERFSDAGLRDSLRHADSAEALFDKFISFQ